ncbi:PTS trehalose transporter subunit IIBC [Mycoplasmopsis cricetuli]|uniref:PTS trehalose transporter subunit IIBC n=1 Tax=Mycoplasmopsis cricetuli TaxID=171283 RepID=UPI000470A47D|nr:PTS trehalose transporter subunit IIBC [Mycoplasmopsis cricetuli]
MEKKLTNKEIVDVIIENIGGFENIKSATHCISRFRLVLKDNKLVNIPNLESLSKVKGTFFTQGQFHIIIGTDVAEYFNILKQHPSFESIQVKDKMQLKKNSMQNLKWYEKIFTHFSEIFIPIIPALVAGGLILGFRNILETNWNGYVIANNISFFNGLNSFLWIPAAAIFWYLPVGICYSVFKKMGSSPILGIIVGLTLLVELPNLYLLSGNSAENSLWIFNWITKNDTFKFGNWIYPFKIGYTAQVIPALGVAFVGALIERYLNKFTPNLIKQILVPLVTILISYSLAMLIIGPFGYIIGYGISEAVKWGLTNSIAKYIFAPIFGLIYAPLVVTGLHHGLNALMIQNTAQLNGSFVFPILAISNISQGAAVLAFVIMNNKDKKTKELGLPAFISCWLGVTEPAMYGINLKKIFPFIGAILASSVGALLLTIFGVTSNGIGSGGVFGILSIQTQSKVSGVYTLPGTGFLWFAVAAIATIVLAGLFTYFLSKIKLFNKEITKKPI